MPENKDGVYEEETIEIIYYYQREKENIEIIPDSDKEIKENEEIVEESVVNTSDINVILITVLFCVSLMLLIYQLNRKLDK